MWRLLPGATEKSGAPAVIVAPVIADELFGVITKVDVEGKRLTVVEKRTDKKVEVTTNDDTEYVTPRGSSKLDLEKLSRRVEGIKGKGKKGLFAKVTHEKGVASKITVAVKRKEAPKSDQ